MGEADDFGGGCCHVPGFGVCPLRWYISDAGEVLASDRSSLGTVTEVIRSFVGNSKPRQNRVAEQIQGARYLCSAAVLAIDEDPSILTDRAAFEAAWAARPEYAQIADVWETLGKPRAYCMEYGPSEGQCCHSETTEENSSKAATLSTTAVSIRRSAPGAS